MNNKDYIKNILIIAITILSFSIIFYSNKITEAPVVEIKNTEMINIGEKINVKHGIYKISNEYKILPTEEDGNKKIILLTIDDGPSHQSLEMVKILKEKNVGAIFFINGQRDSYYKNIIKEIYIAGFPIGNHTWGHLNLKKEIDLDIIKKEIDKNTKLIREITGNDPLFFRPPYGASNQFVRDYIKEKNMIFMNWTGSAKDWEYDTKDPNIFISNIINDLENGSIILIHEHPWSLEALPKLIEEIEKAGYIFADPKLITR